MYIHCMKLWLVEIHEDDWDYDRFESAVIWAHTPEEAEAYIRAAARYPDRQEDPILAAEQWIEGNWRLTVTLAPTDGIALVHWHAG